MRQHSCIQIMLLSCIEVDIGQKLMCSRGVQTSSVVNDAAFDLSSKTSSWKNMPMMAIMASLPLASSADSFLVFSAGSEEVKTFHPKSPAAAAVPADWSWETSQKAMYAKICPHPAAGTLEIAAKPLGTSANFNPADGER